MSRPTRQAEALEILQSYYRDNGILPSFSALTELMGYRSPGSTFPVVKGLIEAGYLEQEGRGGRLKPGPQFGSGGHTAAGSLPPGTVVQVSLAVPAELGILVGDSVIYDPTAKPAVADLLVLQSDDGIYVQKFDPARKSSPGTVLGVLVMQFRRYRP